MPFSWKTMRLGYLIVFVMGVIVVSPQAAIYKYKKDGSGISPTTPARRPLPN